MKIALRQSIAVYIVVGSFFVAKCQPSMGFELSAFFEKTPHLRVPFNLSIKDYSIDTKFLAGGNYERTYIYTFRFAFICRDASWQERDRVNNILGVSAPRSSSIDNRSGKSNGAENLPIPVKLVIYKANGASSDLIYENQLAHLRYGGGGEKSVYEVIDDIKLDPGEYHINLQVLDQVSAVDGIPVEFEIGVAKK